MNGFSKPPSTKQSFTADDVGTVAYSVKFGETSVFSVYTYGTFGSGTLKLQGSPEDTGTNWTDITSISFTAAGVKSVSGFHARRLRWVLSGSTTPAIDAFIVGVSTGVSVVNS